MSKMRKLSLAAMLLSGGYVAAWLLGGVPEIVLPNVEALSSADVKSSWLAGFKRWLSQADAPAGAGQLVPESVQPLVTSPAAPTYAATSINRPTWLSTTLESVEPAPPAYHPAAADPPQPFEVPPANAVNTVAQNQLAPRLAKSQPDNPLSEQPSTPKARITEVRSVAAVSTQPAASPWDRWPRWPENETGVQRQAVPATFQDLSTARKPAFASLHEDEVVRKNSPALDPGAAPADALRTHVVIDGDTLSRLAERYLDDVDRSDEIYRLNRDVLTNPELLPIGMELRIPARQRSGDSVAALLPADGLAVNESRGSPAMVPVPWMPKPFDDAPRAELLRPIPAGSGE